MGLVALIFHSSLLIIVEVAQSLAMCYPISWRWFQLYSVLEADHKLVSRWILRDDGIIDSQLAADNILSLWSTGKMGYQFTRELTSWVALTGF